MESNSHAAEFIGIYIAIANHGAKKPPEPFASVVAQAIQVLAPLAAHILIQDRLVNQPKPVEPVKE
jgi:hypothetical protein